MNAVGRRHPLSNTEEDEHADHQELTRDRHRAERLVPGTVYIDPVATASPPSRLQAASVHFTPGARTAWHTHPFGQTIFVTEGIGRCQHRGGPVQTIRPGDRVYFEPGEDHWHGAAPNRFMTHIAMQEVGEDGSPVSWGEHVTDEQYNAAPAS